MTNRWVASGRRGVAIAAVSGAAVATPLLAQDVELVVETDHFELISSARMSLHHFLVDWAAADADEWPPYALPIVEREEWEAELTAAERARWAAAVETYASTVGRSFVFDDGLISLRAWAAGELDRRALDPEERSLADAVESVLGLYEARWWPEHHASNRAWITSVATRLDEIEERMIERFEAAYGGSWPESRIPIDIVVYANDVGAYSTADRLTISSRHRGNEMPWALEMVFHEASHTDAMERPLRDAIREAFRSAGVPEPDRFWHDAIFFTSGDLTRLVLAEDGDPGYEHYASFGVYRRAERWRTNLPAFEEFWRPFLESRATSDAQRAAALRRVAERVGAGDQGGIEVPNGH